MEKKQKIIQIYAIIICVITITTIIFSIGNFVSSVIDRNDPLYAGWNKENINSYEQFKLDVLKSVTKDQVYIPDDIALKKMYEDAKQEKINTIMHQTKRSMLVDGFIIGICLILALSHWWIIKKQQA
ncbi:MAG: hypothetical protein KGZ87_05265 [Bacteroidetes bacterium]|nr:hypothetical protein [Bacteroidota bacterium]